MGLFDALKGVLDEGEAAALPSVLARVMPGGLQGMVGQLQQSGLGAQVSSWLGSGANEPISAAQLQSVLQEEHVAGLAQSLGIPTDKVFEFLSAHLPGLIDAHSPDGAIQEPGAVPGQPS
jgi:uncharacterized protein YidB (DUF937 family)